MAKVICRRPCPIFLRQDALMEGKRRSWILLPDLDDLSEILSKLLKNPHWHRQELSRMDMRIYDVQADAVVICIPSEDMLAIKAAYSRIRLEYTRPQVNTQ